MKTLYLIMSMCISGLTSMAQDGMSDSKQFGKATPYTGPIIDMHVHAFPEAHRYYFSPN